MRNSIVLAGVVALAVFGPAAARGNDLIQCTSVDGQQQLTLEVVFADDGESGTIVRIDIPTPDVLLTTAEEDGEPGLTMVDAVVGWNTISVSLENPRNAHTIAQLDITRAIAFVDIENPESEAYWDAIGGTFSLDGRGAWVVRCSGWAWR